MRLAFTLSFHRRGWRTDGWDTSSCVGPLHNASFVFEEILYLFRSLRRESWTGKKIRLHERRAYRGDHGREIKLSVGRVRTWSMYCKRAYGDEAYVLVRSIVDENWKQLVVVIRKGIATNQ
jgi:hypothetical protein